MSYPSTIEYDTAVPLMYPFLNHGQFLCLTLTWLAHFSTVVRLTILSFLTSGPFLPQEPVIMEDVFQQTIGLCSDMLENHS